MFDVVSTISPKMMASLQRKGVATARRIEFRNWVDASAICPTNHHEGFRQSLGIPPEAAVALYSGNMGAKRGVEYLEATAERLLTQRPDVRFLICGCGPMKDRLSELTAKLSNVILLDLQPAPVFHQLLTMADIHLLPQRPEINDSVLPGRLASMLASGRPIVAMANSNTQLFAELDGAGIVVPPGEVDAFATAILNLVDDPEMRRELGAKGREYATAVWDRATILGRIEDKLLEFRKVGSEMPVTDDIETVEFQSVHNQTS